MQAETEVPVSKAKRVERVIEVTTTVYICPICERDLKGRSDKVYCSDACRKAGERRRERERST